MGERLKKTEATEGIISEGEEMWFPSEAEVKYNAEEFAGRTVLKGRVKKKKRGGARSTGAGEENRVRFNWGEAKTVVGCPGRGCGHSRLKKLMERRGGGT